MTGHRDNDNTQSIIAALNGDETIHTVALRFGMRRNALHAIAISEGYDWEGRKDRIRKAGTVRRVEAIKTKAKQKADESLRKWLRGESTMSGDMSSLMGLRNSWI